MSNSPTHKKFFEDELKDWSDRKLNLLEKYLAGSTRILSTIGAMCYVDGFAGCGIYHDDQNSKGSPVRAAELALRYQAEGKPKIAVCVNIEENRNNFANLQINTARFGNLVVNLSGTFAFNIDNILGQMQNRPALCFLDPFGVEGIERAAVTKLIARRYPTDLWIRFDTKSLLRLAGFLTEASNGKKGAQAKAEIVCKVYGIDDRDYLRERLISESPENNIAQAINLYLECLSSDFAQYRGEGYACDYKIKSLDGEDKYHLVFATGNPKGIILANDVVYNVEETYQLEVKDYAATKRQAQTTRQISMYELLEEPTAQEIFDSKVAHLKKAILEIGNEIKSPSVQLITNLSPNLARTRQSLQHPIPANTITRSALYIRLIIKLDWFGKFKGTHLTKALQALVKEEKLTVISATNSKAVSHDDATFGFL